MILYQVVAYRSATLCRVFGVKHLRNIPTVWGTYKSKKYAKKIATNLRKDRCRTVDGISGATYKDHGPSFSKVEIREIQK